MYVYIYIYIYIYIYTYFFFVRELTYNMITIIKSGAFTGLSLLNEL